MILFISKWTHFSLSFYFRSPKHHCFIFQFLFNLSWPDLPFLLKIIDGAERIIMKVFKFFFSIRTWQTILFIHVCHRIINFNSVDFILQRIQFILQWAELLTDRLILGFKMQSIFLRLWCLFSSDGVNERVMGRMVLNLKRAIGQWNGLWIFQGGVVVTSLILFH